MTEVFLWFQSFLERPEDSECCRFSMSNLLHDYTFKRNHHNSKITINVELNCTLHIIVHIIKLYTAGQILRDVKRCENVSKASLVECILTYLIYSLPDRTQFCYLQSAHSHQASFLNDHRELLNCFNQQARSWSVWKGEHAVFVLVGETNTSFFHLASEHALQPKEQQPQTP